MPHHQRRRGDRPWGGWQLWAWRAERVWQDVVPLIALGLAFYAVLHVESKATRNRQFLVQQAQGRKVAIDVLCGGVLGVERAGILTLQGKLLDTRRLGMTGQERRLRERASLSYAKIISRAVVRQAGIGSHAVLRPDGTLDCAKLRVAAKSPGG